MKLPLLIATLFLAALLAFAGGNAAAADSRSALTTANHTAQVGASTQIYWIDADTGTIRRANSDGSGAIEDLIASGEPTSLALDLAAGKLYWTDTNAGKIRWADLNDLSSRHDLYSLGSPTSLVLDSINGELYWTDRVPGSIWRANADGSSSVPELLVLEGEPTSLALDPASQDMYWTDGATEKIRRAKMGRSILDPIDDLAIDLVWPDNLALDLTQGQMYWTEWSPGRVRRANLPGAGNSTIEDIENLVGFISGLPTGLALDLLGGKAYWTDGVTHTIQSSDLDGGGFTVTDVFTAVDGLNAPEGITVPAPLTVPTVLQSAPLLYWVDEEAQKIQRIIGEGDVRSVDNLATSALGLNMPGSIALDPLAGKVYWTDDGTEGASDGNIQRANLDGTDVQTLKAGLADPVGIALDLEAGYLYWADRNQGAIYRSNESINQDALQISAETLVGGLDRPYQIALDTANGHMYWTERGRSKIRRADLDGGNVTDLAFGLVAPLNPFGLALDPVSGTMYWTERSTSAGGDVIVRADLDGQNGRIVTGSSYHSLSGIAVDVNDGKIYWTDEDTGTIRRVDPADPNRAVEVVVTGLSSPEGIAVSRPFLSSTRLALTAFYRATDGPNWTNNYNWLSAEHPGTWHGVTTDETEGVVIGLNLIYNRLTGQIPPELGNLDHLEWLNLSFNRLSGEIPEALVVGLPVLKELDLSNNRLTGKIPPQLGNLSNLFVLDLSHNQLGTAMVSGPFPPEVRQNIPEELGGLGNLDRLYLSHNQLEGGIPTALGNLASLSGLDMSNNYLSGEIPEQLGDLEDLEVLLLGSNDLEGPIPADLARLTNLETLTLRSNRLEGAIPDLSALSDTLRWLNLEHNELKGEIPPWLGDFTELRGLGLGHNGLWGTIPTALGGLTNLRVLYIDDQDQFRGRQLTSTDTGGAGPALALAMQMEESYLHGPIPPELDNLANLEVLSLSQNRLSGSIPHQLGNLSNVRWMHLYDNDLSGSIPQQLGNLSNLEMLNLSQNQLGGSITASLGDLANLRGLYLYRNNLNGLIPQQLGNLPNLEIMNLSQNQLTGAIPVELGDLTRLTKLYLYNNDLREAIPANVVNLPLLTRLRLYGNDFDGCVQITGERAEQINLIIDAHGVPPTCQQVAEARLLDEKKREYAALQNLYRATNGGNWKNSKDNTNVWRVGVDVYHETITLESFKQDTFDYSNWHGVQVENIDGENRIVGLRLNDNNLQGAIPRDLDKGLPYLEWLTLGGNRLEGCIPTELSLPLAVGEGFRDPTVQLANYEPGVPTAVALATVQGAATTVAAENITKDLERHYDLSDPDKKQKAKSNASKFLNKSIAITNAVERVFQSSAIKLNVPVCAPTAPRPSIPEGTNPQTSDTDKEILLKVKEHFVGQCVAKKIKETEAECIEHNKFGNWEEGRPWSNGNIFERHWGGAQIENGRVTRLSLDDRNLRGSIPAELGGLGELKYLNLSGNHLTGPIPPELGNLVYLETLGLNNNRLANIDKEGAKTLPPIPPELGNLVRLQEFNVQVNDLEGWLPLELSMLTRHSLTQMDLDREGGGDPTVVQGCLPAYNWATTEARFALGDLAIDVGVTVAAVAGAIPTLGATAPAAVAGAGKVAATAARVASTWKKIQGARTALRAWAGTTVRSTKFGTYGAGVVNNLKASKVVLQHPKIVTAGVATGGAFTDAVTDAAVESALEAYGGPIGRAWLTDISLTEFVSDLSGKGAIIMGKVWCGDP